MKNTIALLLTICASLLSPQLLAGDLSGFWQHEEQPAWIEVRFEEGVGTGSKTAKSWADPVSHAIDNCRLPSDLVCAATATAASAL